MSTTETARQWRIGEVAARLGTTPRTIRYYEEIGLVPCGGNRAEGTHRCYDETEVERIAEILRLKELLGLSLEAVGAILEAEDARNVLRERFASTEDMAEKARIAADAVGHVERQLELVSQRRHELSQLEEALSGRRQRLLQFLEECRPAAGESQPEATAGAGTPAAQSQIETTAGAGTPVERP